MKMVKKKKEIQTCILFPLHHTDVGFSVHTRGDKKSIILFMSQRIDSDISQAIPFSYQCWTPSGMVFKLLRHLYLIGTWKWFMLVLMVVVLNISFIINTIYDFISMHMIMITCIFVTCFGFWIVLATILRCVLIRKDEKLSMTISPFNHILTIFFV